MPDKVQLHFIMLAAGEVIKERNSVNVKNIQDYLLKDEAFKTLVSSEDCKMALWLLEDSGFIQQVKGKEYTRPDLIIKDADG